MITLLAFQQVDLFAELQTIVVMAISYFASSALGAIAQRRYQHPAVRQLTLILIMVIAIIALLGTLNR
jgi:uncharacterized membrane protein YfcA